MSIIENLSGDDPNEEAWERLYAQYGEAVVHYVVRLGLDEDTARDVLQETMLQLADRMKNFSYDRSRGRFRNFLLTFAHRNALKRLRRKSRKLEASLENVGEPAEAVPDEGTPLFDDEAWKLSLLQQAVESLRRDAELDAHTFQVFEAYVLKERPAAEVATTYGIKENAVYQVKNRMVKRLREWMKANGTLDELS